METLEDKVKKFLAIDIGDGCGSGSGYGYKYNCGYNYCDGNGCGSGCGSGSNDSKGYGSGDGSGYGDDEVNSCGYGEGNSCGDGDGNSCGYGCGYGDGNSTGLKEINGKKVYIVDGTSTIFTSVRGNVTQGFIVKSDLQLTPCFIVKENNKFAHGNTLRDAFESLQEKLYDNSTEEERIEAFKKKFPFYDEKYDNRDLFSYHHVLTGSCRMGREEFVKGKGLSLDGKTSVREFVELTKNAYGGDIIKELPKAYGIE